nr:hypothetical protein GCM10020063_017000 [Dactylosporangium thailandense]
MAKAMAAVVARPFLTMKPPCDDAPAPAGWPPDRRDGFGIVLTPHTIVAVHIGVHRVACEGSTQGVAGVADRIQTVITVDVRPSSYPAGVIRPARSPSVTDGLRSLECVTREPVIGLHTGAKIAPKRSGRSTAAAGQTITGRDVRWCGHRPDGRGYRLDSGSPTVTADRIVAAWQH